MKSRPTTRVAILEAENKRLRARVKELEEKLRYRRRPRLNGRPFAPKRCASGSGNACEAAGAGELPKGG